MPAFEIDERKLREGLARAPAPRTLDDDLRAIKMVGWFIAAPLLLLASLTLFLGSLLSHL